MDKNHPTAFISYSWDSVDHQRWVVGLTNKLRAEGGVEANIDVFETQSKTTNLNKMMVEQIRINDFIIVVLTEKYAAKANEFAGGVGFESILTLPILRKNPDKLIFITRNKGDFQEAFPFHLEDYYAIDFSNDKEYEEKFVELVHRLHKRELYEKSPVGPVPDFDSFKKRDHGTKEVLFEDGFSVSVPKQYSDLDKKRFMEDSFSQICSRFDRIFKQLEAQNTRIRYSMEQINSKKYVFEVFIDGELKTGLKIWIDKWFGSSDAQIMMSYGTGFGYGHDSGTNENISSEVENGKLYLRMTMDYMGDDSRTVEDIVKSVWERHLHHYFK